MLSNRGRKGGEKQEERSRGRREAVREVEEEERSRKRGRGERRMRTVRLSMSPEEVMLHACKLLRSYMLYGCVV